MPADRLPDETQSAVESFVADWVADNRIPGAAVAVTDADGLAYAEGFGARQLEGNEPATPDTLFPVASCTKAFTATAILQLVERGDLALDDPVDDYVPHLADAPGEPITVAELLAHTSGMPSDGSALPLISRSLGQGHVEVPLSSEADFRRHVEGSVDRRVTDRETFFYYNSGYTILGRVIEAVTDRSFAAYVADEILTPLGMERSTFDRAAFEDEADRMTPYVRADGSATEAGVPFDALKQPAGGLVSSVRELSRFVLLFAGDGAVDGERVLSPDSVDAMTTPVGTYGTYLDGTKVGYGYGVMTQSYLGDRLVGHGGSLVVSNAWFGYLEDADLGVTLACSTGPETHPTDAGMGVLALLRGEDPTDVQPHYRLLEALGTVAGDYESYRGIGSAAVERVGGGLRVEVTAGGLGGQELLLAPDRIEDEALVCETADASGIAREARFEFGGEGVTLFFERDRFERAE